MISASPRERLIAHLSMLAFSALIAGSFTTGALAVPYIHPFPLKGGAKFVNGATIMVGRGTFDLANPWLANGAKALFHKGRDYRREVEESRDAWHFDLLQHNSAVDREGVILEISGLRRK